MQLFLELTIEAGFKGLPRNIMHGSLVTILVIIFILLTFLAFFSDSKLTVEITGDLDEAKTFNPKYTYPGVAFFMQNLFIFFASVIYKFGRSEDMWG